MATDAIGQFGAQLLHAVTRAMHFPIANDQWVPHVVVPEVEVLTGIAKYSRHGVRMAIGLVQCCYAKQVIICCRSNKGTVDRLTVI